MEVIRSKNAGACYGVQRALDLALKASEGDGSAFTLGPLIHNPQVVANLEARGVLAVKEPEQATHGAIIIRSHGVTPAVRRSVEARGLPVIDATCPHVARAQKAAATLAEECGYVVVVGEEGHPEVEGLVAYAHEAGAQVHVAETAADLPSDLPEHVGVVVQTTQTRDALDDVLEGIRAQGVAAQVKDTVCTATRQRQQAAAELAGQVDAIVVIGGRNSANTTHLAEICAAECPRTHHIESAAELDPAWFAGCTSVGVHGRRQHPRRSDRRGGAALGAHVAIFVMRVGLHPHFPVRRHGDAFPIYSHVNRPRLHVLRHVRAGTVLCTDGGETARFVAQQIPRKPG